MNSARRLFEGVGRSAMDLYIFLSIRNKFRRASSAKIFLTSGLFDWGWISVNYSFRSKRKFIFDYIDTWADGQIEPNELFDSLWYVNEYPDALNGYLSPLEHYIEMGSLRGYSPSHSFDSARYLFNNRDVLAAMQNPLAHYLLHGRQEGRPFHSLTLPEIQKINDTLLFDAIWYASTYDDIKRYKLDPLEHFAIYGWKEGRNPSEYFDLAWFSERYAEEIGSKNPLIFYSERGHDPKYIPSRRFDPAWYLEQNHDLRSKGINPLFHYMNYGLKEGRSIAALSEIKEKPARVVNKSLVNNPQLMSLSRFSVAQTLSRRQNRSGDGLSLHIVIPDFSAGAGGHMTIFRLLHLLELRGFKIVVWIFNPNQHQDVEQAYDDILRYFQPLAGELKFFDESSFLNAQGDILVATSWETVYPVMANGNFLTRFYLVQDFEPDFYPAGSLKVAAENTYGFDINCFCASPWLSHKLETQYGRWTRFFYLSSDREIYFPPNKQPKNVVPRIAFYARQFTARRAVELGFLALEELARTGFSFHVDFFGENTHPTTDHFSFTNHGVLSTKECAELYRNCDVGVVFSLTNYSLVPKEMMACLLPVVEFETESTRAIFPPGVVTFGGKLPQDIAAKIHALLLDEPARVSQAWRAKQWSDQFTWKGAASIFETAILDRLRESTGSSLSTIFNPANLKAAVIIPTLNGGNNFEQLVEALNIQETPWAFETVIIDSGSTDGTLQTALKIKNSKIIQIPKSEFGHGKTRNLGFIHSSAPFVAFLTQDAIPVGKDWLFNLVSSLERRADAAGVFGAHVAYEDASPFVKFEISEHFRLIAKLPTYLSESTRTLDVKLPENQIKQLMHFYSDNNSCMRRAVWELYPYPEVPYGEDQIWAREIIKAGYSKGFSPNAVVRHSHNYDYDETLQRSMIESDYFYSEFGYDLLSGSTNVEDVIQSMNSASAEFARIHCISKDLLSVQFQLNKAKILGYKLGIENARKRTGIF